MPRREDSANKYWISASLDTDEGSQTVSKFVHPKREADFPDLYLLQEPHPLRPEYFTPANHPRCTRPSFKDYVVTIHKTSEFMDCWQRVGSNTATPTDDVPSNQEDGMCLTFLDSPQSVI